MDRRKNAVGLVYGYYEHALLDRFRFDVERQHSGAHSFRY